MLKGIKDKKKLLIFVCITLIFIVACIYISNKNKPYNIGDKYGFSEINSVNFNFNEEEKANINEVLERRKIEDATFFGFVSENTQLIDMYTANGVVKLCGLLDNYEQQYLEKEFNFLSTVDLNSMDILNLVYYVEISNALGIEIDYELINDAMDRFYDFESKLFFIDNINDSIHTKIVITSLCKKAMGDKISSELFQLEEGIRRAYENYEFKMDSGASFYNSGADIVYCYSIFGIENELNYDKISGWYVFWKNEYENLDIQSFMSALQYSEYLNVAKILEQQYTVEKLYDYYNNMNTAEISEINDLFAIYNTFKNIEVLDNDNVNEILKSKIDNVLEENELYDLKIDVKSTAIGVLVAQQTGYELDYNKLKNYIDSTYNSIKQIDDIYTKTEVLYYNIILDQLINGYVQEYDVQWLQNQVDTTLNEINYEDSIVTDIIVTRRIVEIVMDLQMFDADVFLTNSQVQRIKDGVEVAYKNEMFECSLICELYLLDSILSLDVVDTNEFYELYNELKDGNGVKCMTDNEMVADLMTTYQFNICFERMGDNSNYVKGKDFAKNMMMEEGIYKMSDLSESEGTLEAILYGNILNNVSMGEKNND